MILQNLARPYPLIINRLIPKARKPFNDYGLLTPYLFNCNKPILTKLSLTGNKNKNPELKIVG